MNDRTIIAAIAMHYLISLADIGGDEIDHEWVTSKAVRYADALLEELGATAQAECMAAHDEAYQKGWEHALDEAAKLIEYDCQGWARNIRALKTKSEAG